MKPLRLLWCLLSALTVATVVGPSATAVAQERPEGEAVDAPGLAGEPPEAHPAPSLRELFALDNYEFWGPVFNFLLFVFIIVFFAGPRIQQSLADRRKQVAHDLDEAQRLRAEAQAKHDEYTRRLAQLDEEMDRLRQEMIRAGESERDRIVAEAEAKASRMRKETKFVIEQQIKQLREDLTREAVEAAVSAAEQVLTDKTTGADQQRLAKQYLGILEGQGGAAGPARTGGTSPSGEPAAAKGGDA
jgi:F-type H+-transporting ATPase subunit b